MHIIDCAVQIKFCTVIDRCPHVIFSSVYVCMYVGYMYVYMYVCMYVCILDTLELVFKTDILCLQSNGRGRLGKRTIDMVDPGQLSVHVLSSSVFVCAWLCNIDKVYINSVNTNSWIVQELGSQAVYMVLW